MNLHAASRTALAAAHMRAAHQLLDARPLLLDDPVAVPLLGRQAAQAIRDGAASQQTPWARALRSHVLLRSVFAEERLAAAVGRGVAQFVVLGAGFDTFFLRQPPWARALRVFEMDHPATQELKWEYLARAGLEPPPNATLAPVDLEREPLVDGCARHGVSLTQPTLFSWLGVTMYLPESAIDSVLRSVARFPLGSELVLTFLQPADSAGEESSRAQRHLAERVAGAGEPFVTRFEPVEVEARLRAAGFSGVEFLSPEEAEARYYARRPRDLPVPSRTGIAAATR
jgi:methyltransferase (TIGR00027 family)